MTVVAFDKRRHTFEDLVCIQAAHYNRRRCFYHSFEYYGNVDAGPENIGTLVVLGGDRRGVGIVVLSAGFVSDLLFICMLWRISDCRMDQLEKERKVV